MKLNKILEQLCISMVKVGDVRSYKQNCFNGLYEIIAKENSGFVIKFKKSSYQSDHPWEPGLLWFDRLIERNETK